MTNSLQLFSSIGLVAISSCLFYFDYKRRNDLEFYKYLKNQQKLAAELSKKRSIENAKPKKDYSSFTNIPEPISDAEKEAYVMKNLQVGETLLVQGPDAYEAAATCFYNSLKHIAQVLFLKFLNLAPTFV